LAYFDDGGRTIITASNAGLAANPDWYHNLTSQPHVGLQLGSRRLQATAEVATPAERSRLWARLIELAPGYAAYARRTKRVIPMVILRPVAD
jgi:deazaflavin-dependent oxidoreductase (nitroreductase family)